MKNRFEDRGQDTPLGPLVTKNTRVRFIIPVLTRIVLGGHLHGGGMILMAMDR